MNLIVTPALEPMGDAAPVELAERKGIGHPDTICDSLAEELSIALCQYYLDHFGAVLHNNVDKALLAAGSARPAFGGGQVLKPFDITLAGRGVREFRGETIPVEELAQQATKQWFGTHMQSLDPDHHVRIHCLVRPGSVDLVDLFRRSQHVGTILANDTSCGVAHAPLSVLERVVLAVESQLNQPIVKETHPHLGEDVKVLGVRSGSHIELTVACAQVDRYVPDLAAYQSNMAGLEEMVREAARGVTSQEVAIKVNAGDDLEQERVYLTVTGTSAEAGDDGAAGRGNRLGGLATPLRPMSLDSVAGKNPIHHTGKLYNVVAHQVAEALVADVPAVAAAECCIVSQIGKPLTEPQLVHVRMAAHDGAAVDGEEELVREIVRARLDRIDGLWRLFPERAVTAC